MGDLITRTYMFQALAVFNDRENGNEHFLNGIETAREIVENAPVVDAEPVRHGRWLECEDGWGDTHYQCSECGAEWNLDAGTPDENGMIYCPHCGARMDEEG